MVLEIAQTADKRSTGEPTFAAAILGRLVHNAYGVELDGQSMHNTKLKTGDESAPSW